MSSKLDQKFEYYVTVSTKNVWINSLWSGKPLLGNILGMWLVWPYILRIEKSSFLPQYIGRSADESPITKC